MDITYSKNLLYINTENVDLSTYIKKYFESYIAIERISRIKLKNVQFDLGLAWGPKRSDQIIPFCKKVITIEAPLFRELQDSSFSFMKSCNNGQFAFVFRESNNSDRWEKLKAKVGIDSIEWQSRGDAIIFLLQYERDYLNKRSEDQYASHVIKTIKKIREITNRKIILRPHPETEESFFTKLEAIAFKYFKVVLENGKSLDEHLTQAHCCIVFGLSTSGVHSILRGVPVIALDDATQYSSVSNKMENIEDLDYSIDLEKWQNTLGYSIWDIEEFKSGEVWNYILN